MLCSLNTENIIKYVKKKKTRQAAIQITQFVHEGLGKHTN
jgi:hypothetical protein